jgi:hypothetical protein
MKKIISLAIAVFLIGSPIAFANAQTTTGTKTTISTAQLEQLLSLLVTELAALEQEYNQLEAAQANTAQELSQIASSTVATTTVASTSQTLSQLEAVVPQVVQTTTVTRQQSVAVSNSSQNTQQVASAAPTVVPSLLIVSQDPSFTGATLTAPIGELASFLVTNSSSIEVDFQPYYQITQSDGRMFPEGVEETAPGVELKPGQTQTLEFQAYPNVQPNGLIGTFSPLIDFCGVQVGGTGSLTPTLTTVQDSAGNLLSVVQQGGTLGVGNGSTCPGNVVAGQTITITSSTTQ